MKKALELAVTLWFAAASVVGAIEAENDTPGSGAVKKAKAIEKLLPLLNTILPSYLEPVAAILLPLLIDAVVTLANRSDFLGGSSTAPKPA